MGRGWRREAKRYGAPAAFLLAVTVAVLLVRSGLQSDPAAPATGSKVTVILDGRSLTFTLPRDGDSVLDETLRARSDAPYACKNAVCGTCRAKVVEGKVEMDSNYALEPDEIARGYVLTCQAHPTTDTLTVDFDQ